jgi:hypothetical protein
MSIQLQNINRQIVLAYKEYDEKVDKSKREPIRERIGHLFEEKRAELSRIEFEKAEKFIKHFNIWTVIEVNKDNYKIDRYNKNQIKLDKRK